VSARPSPCSEQQLFFEFSLFHLCDSRYYQQTGRGGRDGDVCVCTMFYSAGDFSTCSHLIGNSPNAAQAMHMDQARTQSLTGIVCKNAIR
jgi:superfamily II DNA helicase RecQ